MLAIQIEYLTGFCVATAHDDRTSAEWPPHPARLYSALVDVHHTTISDDSSDERTALEWLAEQGPPEIYASAARHETNVATYFVPVNEILRNKDPKKIGALPEDRRQARTFPTCHPDDPRVCFSWPDACPAPAIQMALSHLLERLVRLGHSSSFVVGRLTDSPPPPTLIPRDDGPMVLRVVAPGQLARLEAAFLRHGGVEPRTLPRVYQTYGSPSETVSTIGSIWARDWLVFRRVGGSRPTIEQTESICRALRGAVMRHAAEPIPEVVSGHRPDGSPSAHPHIACWALPFVGYPHADGSVVGVAVAVPTDADPSDRQSVVDAVERWESSGSRLWVGRDEIQLERVVARPSLQSLRSSTWSNPSREWTSTTPVALDRDYGDLWSGSEGSVCRAVRRTVETITTACHHVGLPRPERVAFSRSPDLRGSPHIGSFPRYANGGRRRRMVHVRLRFPEPVSGPFALGAGRFFGVGLMRPVEET